MNVFDLHLSSNPNFELSQAQPLTQIEFQEHLILKKQQ
jgi:hypothetical protein